MLSVLIPVYNFNVRDFVNELHKQSVHESVEFEIILVDDASDEEYRKINSTLNDLQYVQYIQLEKNIGRSKIRNFLAEKAQYNYLFFADCDSAIQKDDFIKAYIQQLNNDVIICGGRSYNSVPPSDHKKYLRWYYGKKRESKRAEERNIQPNRSFMTNNYVISKSIHNSIKFDEKISQYGHEDTLFGIELKRRKISVTHIDNTLEHIGLENNKEFLNKTNKGIKNLVYIIHEYDYPELFEDIKLLRIYNKTKHYSFIFKFTYCAFGKIIRRLLRTKKPSLKLFDLYKLSYLHKIVQLNNHFE
jgi:glutaredoxin